MDHEVKQKTVARVADDPLSMFTAYAELRAEYASLKMALSIFAGSAMVLTNFTACAGVVESIKTTMAALEARMLEIPVEIQGAVDDVVSKIELFKTAAPTDNRQ